MTQPGLVVAIDGPSGSGKSSVSRKVAQRLGLRYLDTGAMYRAATLWCVEQGIDLEDKDAVYSAVSTMPLEMVTDPLRPRVLLNGNDAEPAIRAQEVSAQVSQVSTVIPVRTQLISQQRDIITAARLGNGIVAEGRDITTVVAADADVRILLTADEDVRLARRALENTGSDGDAAKEATRDQVSRRDRDDSVVVDFLTAADGVTLVDSTDLDLEQTIYAVERVVRETSGRQI